jgi:hypothetical protein
VLAITAVYQRNLASPGRPDAQLFVKSIVWIIVLIVVAVAWLAKPKREELSRIRGFLNKTARPARARLDEDFQQLTVPDEDE